MKVSAASEETWRVAAGLIAEGGLVVFPTDTVYGIGCDPRNPEAIERVYFAKGRPTTKALPLLLSSASRLESVAREIAESAGALGAAFWPGAITLVVPRQGDLPVELGGGDTIAVRVPDHDGLRGFIEMCGGAIAATSANISGQSDALDAPQAADYLGEWVELVVDGGIVQGGVPSTVVDCTVDPPAILRRGACSEEEIRRVLELKRDIL